MDISMAYIPTSKTYVRVKVCDSGRVKSYMGHKDKFLKKLGYLYPDARPVSGIDAWFLEGQDPNDTMPKCVLKILVFMHGKYHCVTYPMMTSFVTIDPCTASEFMGFDD